MVCMADPSRCVRQRSAFSRSAWHALAALGAIGSPALAQYIPDEKPPEIRGMELQNKLGQRLPMDLELVDSSGKTVRLGEKFGKGRPVVVTMIYLRCPLLCPQTQQRIIGSFNQVKGFTIGTEYDAIFVSFDPRDTASDAAKAKEIALAQYDRTTIEVVRQGLSYMVGSAENTLALGDALGFPFRFLKQSGEFSHGTAVYVISPEGVISHCFTKLEYDPKDLRLALVDASDGKIGTLLDTFTLWCYHSTLTGEYTIAAMKVMRIGAAGAAVILFAFVGWWAMRDRKRRAIHKRLAAETEARIETARGSGGEAAGTDSSKIALTGALGHSR